MFKTTCDVTAWTRTIFWVKPYPDLYSQCICLTQKVFFILFAIVPTSRLGFNDEQWRTDIRRDQRKAQLLYILINKTLKKKFYNF